jgi:GNAT superfamily N-acetyltransferase
VDLAVRPPGSPEEWATFERLVRSYLASLPFEVDFQDVDRELAELTVEYAPPRGAALVAWDGGEPLGVVGLRPFGDADGEVKRMFVAPAGRGRGAGRALGVAVVAAARELGYQRLLLDTVDTMVEAIGLYRSLGFVEVEAYRFNPLPGARYFALDLRTEK